MMGPFAWALFPYSGSEGHLLDFFQGQSQPESSEIGREDLLPWNTDAKESQALPGFLVAVTHPESPGGWLAVLRASGMPPTSSLMSAVPPVLFSASSWRTAWHMVA